ncbi:MAG: MobA/MobL family protein [Butyrivibrio sp.]|nr:MobA/MobL family protein [Butyrivibrio sp.]
MAIYHLHIKIGGRSKGQSAVAAAAYRAGDKLIDKETGLISDYTRKGGVVHSEISLCDNAPAEYADRETLWNSVHQIEKAKDARLWREIEVALPKEFSREEQIETVREFVKQQTEKGMCADWALHDKGDGNPHAHIMLTVRSIEPSGKWAPKCRKVYDLDENGQRIFQKVDKSGRKQYKSHKEDYNDWNRKERVEEWRSAWADCCNARLSERDRIDHRSYERQGMDQIPTVHEGYAARQIAAKGGISERVEINNEIRERNSLMRKLAEQLKQIASKIKMLGNKLKELNEAEKVHNEVIVSSAEGINKLADFKPKAHIVSKNPTGSSDTGSAAKAETSVMEPEIVHLIGLRNKCMRQAIIVTWLEDNPIKNDAQDDLRKAKELEDNFESYAAEYFQKYGTARSYKRCIEYPPQFSAEEKLNMAAKELQKYLGFMTFPFIASDTRGTVMRNLDLLQKYVKHNMDKKQKAADAEIEKNKIIEALTAENLTKKDINKTFIEYSRACKEMPEDLRTKSRKAIYCGKIPDPIGKFKDSKFISFCNKALNYIYETAVKLMPVPSDLKQQEHNDDNYYRGGRIR